jgi:hypothetical protein
MPQAESEKTGMTQAGEKLFNFAVDREDVKVFIENLPKETKCNSAAVEYELQLLKIISTGWSISFFLEDASRRDQLAEKFWKLIHGFSTSLSETTGLLVGHDIDYFQILKSRLDMYVAALAEKPEMTEPAAIIGPEFAKLCGDIEDIYSVMAGSRMFIITVAQVKDYLEFIERESLL